MHRLLKIGECRVWRCDETTCEMLYRKRVSLFYGLVSQQKVPILWAIVKALQNREEISEWTDSLDFRKKSFGSEDQVQVFAPSFISYT